ncbi:DUF4236 domain-containing protein [Nocardia cyriacigeorgica]|uniref:DUF4236 domain-containing protein n=1 Tax=Nocardia cyriacigeorgica TaxID=135487 RepID=UPI0024573536|nr:DUF4236 domain-containing protein [Nocardia cyriacigeorgica]
MGFYVRRSVSAGPFRFNLSGSGVGVSVGFPGFRVGSGPRGNYVAVGRHGIYYRASFGAGGRARPNLRVGAPTSHPAGQVELSDVTGATPLTLEPTGSGDVVDQLNAAAGRVGSAFPATTMLILTSLCLWLYVPPVGIAIGIAAVPMCVWLILQDRAKSRVVLFYDVTDEPAAWFEQLVRSWSCLTGSQRMWRVVETGDVRTTEQYKRNSGVDTVVVRADATASLAAPKHLATNVAVPTITVGPSSLHFLPDRLLVRDGKRYTDVDYRHLFVAHEVGEFREADHPVPSDTEQTGQRHAVVNKRTGAPDRRFRYNPVCPVVRYGYLDLMSTHGLNWRLQVSRAEAVAPVGAVLGAIPLGR